MQSLFSALQYPFPSRIHPDHVLIEKEIPAFLDVYTFLPPDARKQFEAANFGRLSALWYPDVPFDMLIPAARLVVWIFVFDDHYGPLPLPELKKAHERLIAILRGSLPRPEENAVFQQFSLVHEELACHIRPNTWMTRYIESWEYFFEGQQLEKQYSYKQDLVYPSIEEYMSLREKVGGTYPYVDILEITSGYILPAHIITHPAIQRRRFFVSRLATWDNDLLSYDKEKRDHEAMNLVAVVQHEYNCPLEDAYHIAMEMRNQQVEAYLDLRINWPDFGEHHAAVTDYAARLDWLISGHLEWYRDNPRYQ
ncbi:terpene synthase family protein [Chitinophaga qingshengii]|uniref:Terpene synthase n=1 Tax=Chitinophaga qingshengii TaxID=1569794 RepID=A0ABR7TKN0_9BACT|nr:hypothetical protein [Chitinophaga qingshengii]MBC9930086.1 hypothetical protein [Chitinophaga qingshengii]